MRQYVSGKWLSQYALACGSVERAAKRNTVINMWLEHGVYHVRGHDHDKRGRLFWDTFETVTEARKYFSTKRRELGLNWIH